MKGDWVAGSTGDYHFLDGAGDGKKTICGLAANFLRGRRFSSFWDICDFGNRGCLVCVGFWASNGEKP